MLDRICDGDTVISDTAIFQGTPALQGTPAVGPFARDMEYCCPGNSRPAWARGETAYTHCTRSYSPNNAPVVNAAKRLPAWHCHASCGKNMRTWSGDLGRREEKVLLHWERDNNVNSTWSTEKQEGMNITFLKNTRIRLHLELLVEFSKRQTSTPCYL